MAVNPNEYTSPTAGTIKLGTKSLAGTEGIDVLTGNTSEVDPQSYYRTILPQQPSMDSTAQAMTNVGAELFAANTTYRSIFDRYKNKPGGIRQIGDEMLRAVYPEPEKSNDPPKIPPPSAALKEDFGYMDPGGVGPDSGYTGWDDGNAQVIDYAIEDGTEFSRDATLGEIGSNVVGAAGNLGQFAMQIAPTNVIATLATAAWAALTGNKPPSKPVNLLEVLPKTASRIGDKIQAASTARATASRAQAAIDSFVPDFAAQNVAAQTVTPAAVAAAALSGSNATNVSFDPSGLDDGPGDPGDIGNVGMLASGGTVKAKAKKVPSFMDSK